MPQVAVILVSFFGLAPATAPANPAENQPALREPVQLTTSADFSKAGEAYFSPDMQHVIFQAVPADGSEEHYQMYVAAIAFDPPALKGVTRLSPAGSNNTCGYFSPDGGTILLASTLSRAAPDQQPSGYQRDGGDYKWSFPGEMELVLIPQWQATIRAGRSPTLAALTSNAAYDAEGAFAGGVDRIVFTSNRDGDPDLYLFDAFSERHFIQLTDLPGYDGGAFVSPDGTQIAWRADRNEDDLLQLFVANFKGSKLSNIQQITEDDNVNWAPYWHPSGEWLFYTTSQHGHRNYEVHAIRPDGTGDTRITNADGFDGLPVVSPDGRYLLWTSQRGEDTSSQLWIAELNFPAE